MTSPNVMVPRELLLQAASKLAQRHNVFSHDLVKDERACEECRWLSKFQAACSAPEPSGDAVERALREFWKKEIVQHGEWFIETPQAQKDMRAALAAAYPDMVPRSEYEKVCAERDALQAAYENATAYQVVHRGALVLCSSLMRDAYSDEHERAESVERELAQRDETIAGLKADAERYNNAGYHTPSAFAHCD